MADDLSEFPKQLLDWERMPWEESHHPTWPWGLDAGKKLDVIDSRELVRKRRWLEERHPYGWVVWVQQIDAVLKSREGE